MADFERDLKPRDFNSDLPAELLPPDRVTELANIEVRNGLFNQALGDASALGSLVEKPRYLLPNNTTAVAYWIYASDNAVAVTAGGGIQWVITPPGFASVADVPGPYTGGVLNQIPVLNSLLDGPFFWDQVTANPMQALPGWPASDVCQAMRPFREFLIAMNVFTGGQRIADLVRWSDAAAPGALPQRWDADIDTQAGERSVSFNPGGLVDGRQLLDRFYMYKTTSCYVLQLVGGNFIFTNRPVFSTVGALSRNCIIEWRGRHIVLTNGDLVAHDGTTVESLIKERLRREIFLNLDGDNFENSYLAFSKARNELYVCRPRVGEVYPTEAWVLSLDSGRFGLRALNATGTPHVAEGLYSPESSAPVTWATIDTEWATDSGRWNSADALRISDTTMLANYDRLQGDQITETSATIDGAPIQAAVARGGLDLGAPLTKKALVTVWLKVQGAIGGALAVSVGSHDTPELEPVFAAAQTFVIGTTQQLTFDIPAAYYIAYRIESAGQLGWSLSSIKLQAQAAGGY